MATLVFTVWGKFVKDTGYFRRLIAPGLLCFVSACAPLPQSTRSPVYLPRQEVPASTPPQNEPSSPQIVIAPTLPSDTPTGSAVAALIDDAWRHYRGGDTDKAIAVAERAQRLDARSAEVYLVLASSYLARGQQEVAEGFARRGVNFSSAGSVIRDQLQQLIRQLGTYH